MSYGDPRLTTLYRLARRVEGASLVRVQEAIRDRRRELELADDPFDEGEWRKPAWGRSGEQLERT